jgi:hypothetical protein
MYCPVIVGSDKTTVSVATGHVEYHPFYISPGGVHNTVRRAHRNAVAPTAFLAIPKGIDTLLFVSSTVLNVCFQGIVSMTMTLHFANSNVNYTMIRLPPSSRHCDQE